MPFNKHVIAAAHNPKFQIINYSNVQWKLTRAPHLEQYVILFKLNRSTLYIIPCLNTNHKI